MLTRSVAAALFLASAVPVAGQTAPAARAAEPRAFERRVAAVLDAGGTRDMVENRLERVGSGLTLTRDQRVALDAVRLLLRSRGERGKLTTAQAEAFAARNPGSPGAMILAAEAAMAEDDAQRSADILVALSDKGGSLVDLVSPALVSKLTAKLDGVADKPRTVRLAKALLGSGWSRGTASLRSYLAMEAIRAELAASRVDAARGLLPAITSPASLQTILIDNRLAALRPDVERQSGPRLERQWRAFLDQARDEWMARGDYRTGSAYVAALAQANHHRTIVNVLLPRFTRGYNCPTDGFARATAAELVDSLTRLGRWTKADDVMSKAGGVAVPVYAAMLLEKGEFGRAATMFERSIRAAKRPQDREDEQALAWLLAARDCARFRGGSGGAPASYDPKLLKLSARISMALCRGERDAARAMLLAALEDEGERVEALRWVQPASDPPLMTPFRRQMGEELRSLQRDPQVTAAVARHGVILDWALASSAPAEEEGARSTGRTWRCGDESVTGDHPREPLMRDPVPPATSGDQGRR